MRMALPQPGFPQWMVSVIDCLPEERRGDLTAGLARIGRRTLLAPVRADGTVPGQYLLNHGEERLSDEDHVSCVVDRPGRSGSRLNQVDDHVSRIIQICGYRVSAVAHQAVLS